MEDKFNGMRVLVAVENYPGNLSGEPVTHHFVHVRNAYYRQMGLDVTVLNFSATSDYEYDGLRVICPRTYDSESGRYNQLLCHQPNLKHMVPFCLKHSNEFGGFVFFFHGHEVLKLSVSYPKPYDYCKENGLAVFKRDIYDDLKFKVLRHFFANVMDKSHFVFVSGWMYDEFKKWLKVGDDFLGARARIIPNCIAEEFENRTYDADANKKYDFITVRGNLDTSKYAVDLVIEAAKANPESSFLVIGKGEIFEHFGKPANIEWLDTTMSHSQLADYMNDAKCAFMPTRTDAQGLMMCEMASYGIPLVTSDIAVCREVMKGFENVVLVPNAIMSRKLVEAANSLKPKRDSFSPFSKKNTIEKEIALIREVHMGVNGC